MFVDRIQIQQVLVNLIRNAIDAMVDGPVRSLTIRTDPDPPDFMCISIEDSGSGISETMASQLFQPFVTSKKAGMGIGLVFFGVAEPMQHYAAPPVGAGRTLESARQAITAAGTGCMGALDAEKFLVAKEMETVH